jgi:hypothetical protein
LFVGPAIVQLGCVLANHLSNKSYPLLIFFGLEKKKKKTLLLAPDTLLPSISHGPNIKSASEWRGDK